MVNAATVTLSFSGSTGAISQLLALVAKLESAEPNASLVVEDSNEIPYAGPNAGVPVTLTEAQFKAFYEGIDPLYQKGVKLIAAKGGTVSCDELAAKGIDNPGHFKSRTSVRARTVLKMDRRVQFATYFSKMVKGEKRWFLRVPAATLAAMRSYFGI
ncbi:MAG: hypothetical protein JOZ90_03780 [Alphaproteobacteria bacterium]|nr:hypothetical protein [Alphaproteobacteria bacterium]MBV9371877.1 hypothetical protein [Alphaproteobacteria bacterium]MBV9900200.1 hypothetical protein [Alphaproteobacteria bacterium]